MPKLLIPILVVLLWSTTNVLSLRDSAQAINYNDNGRAANMMEDLVEHTASVTNELLTELKTKLETTSATLLHNMESILSSALHELSQPLADLQQKISSSQCQPEVEFSQLKQQIDSDLATCTQHVHQIFSSLQQDSNEFKAALDEHIKAMVDLPKKCQNLGNGADFGSYVSCYIGNIAALNQQVANILNNASDTIIRTRELGEKAVQEGRTCSNEVIAASKNSVSKIMSNCSKIFEQ